MSVSQPTAIIVEDEVRLADSLQRKLNQLWPELTILDTAYDGFTAEHAIRTLKPSVAFLDINIPGQSGLDVASKIIDCCHIVFITAYQQHAVAAFEHNAVDYLLKPLSGQRLGTTVERLKKLDWASASQSEQYRKQIDALKIKLEAAEKPEYQQHIKVQLGDRTRIIPTGDVLCLIADEKYIRVVTAQQEFLIRTTLSSLEQSLDPALFERASRSALVNVSHIDFGQRTLTGRMELNFKQSTDRVVVSRRYISRFKGY